MQQVVCAHGQSRFRPQDLRTLAGEELLGTVAVDDGQHRAFPRPPAGGMAVGPAGQRRDLDAAGPADLEGGLYGGTRVVDVDVH